MCFFLTYLFNVNVTQNRCLIQTHFSTFQHKVTTFNNINTSPQLRYTKLLEIYFFRGRSISKRIKKYIELKTGNLSQR